MNTRLWCSLAMMLSGVSGRGEEAALSMAIVPTQSMPQGPVNTIDEEMPFEVLFTNRSKEPVKLFADSNSWGWHCLTFEITDKDGQKHTLTRKGGFDFTRNFPETLVIAPGATYVREVNLKDWDGLEGVKLDDLRGSEFTAKFDEPVRDFFDATTKEQGAWEGHASSEPQVFRFIDHGAAAIVWTPPWVFQELMREMVNSQ